MVNSLCERTRDVARIGRRDGPHQSGRCARRDAQGTLREQLFGHGPLLPDEHPGARYRDIERMKRESIGGETLEPPKPIAVLVSAAAQKPAGPGDCEE